MARPHKTGRAGRCERRPFSYAPLYKLTATSPPQGYSSTPGEQERSIDTFTVGMCRRCGSRRPACAKQDARYTR